MSPSTTGSRLAGTGLAGARSRDAGGEVAEPPDDLVDTDEPGKGPAPEAGAAAPGGDVPTEEDLARSPLFGQLAGADAGQTMVLGGPPPPLQAPDPARADEPTVDDEPAVDGSPDDHVPVAFEVPADEVPPVEVPAADEVVADEVPVPDEVPAAHAVADVALGAEPDADPHDLARAVARLSASSARSGQVALGILSAVLGRGERVEGLVQGTYQDHPAVLALTDGRLVVVNDRRWDPVQRTIALSADLVVQGLQDDATATLTFVTGGEEVVVDAIADRPLARELAGLVRSRVDAQS